ncbi:hypothetical protein GUJ93_ZPchr0007g5980 [Zizania palustris]|uniref:Uncharacterized protein n=1 Tax=Zizania palustris TaxID=103762 RepID=A0A8J5T4Q9_ZIZPA|nr:hypothetical protein GUJ93_ZPchr0007g5980 [Zizania palustris]
MPRARVTAQAQRLPRAARTVGQRQSSARTVRRTYAVRAGCPRTARNAIAGRRAPGAGSAAGWSRSLANARDSGKGTRPLCLGQARGHAFPTRKTSERPLNARTRRDSRARHGHGRRAKSIAAAHGLVLIIASRVVVRGGQRFRGRGRA